MTEEWRVIPSCPLYEASSHGRIRNLKSGRPNAIYDRPDGRIGATLYIDGRLRSKLVHRLVLEAFVGCAPPNTECNHKDGNTRNNYISNLEWVTRSVNLRHAYANDLNSQSGEENGNAKFSRNDVQEIKRMLRSGMSQKQIAALFNRPSVTINHISTGRTWEGVI